MPLFNIPQRAGREADKNIAKKSNSKSAPIKKTSGVLDRIDAIKVMVDRNLGKFRDEYIVIRDEDTLTQYIDKCIENDVISIDTETSGLDTIDDKLVGLCIYTPNMKAAYIPVGHVSYLTMEKLPDQLPISILHEQFERLKDVKVIMFNANFDLRVLRHSLDVYLDCYWDCYIAARLLNENEGVGNNGLKALHRKYVLDGQEDAFSYEAMFRGTSFDIVPIEYAYLYAAHDAIITYELYEFQKQYLRLDSPREDMRRIADVFFNIEMPCVEVVCDMEDNGVTFDLEYNKQLAVKYNALLEEKLRDFHKELEKYRPEIDRYRQMNIDNKLDDPINIGSPYQLAILLYDILKVGVIDEKKSRGTGEEILKRIDLPIAKVILDYREFAKLIEAFISKLPLAVKKDGKIHCTLNQYGADTGRMSCENPNLQQIPSHNKDIRKMFTAQKGYILMSSDYSQQEPKVMAQMCGDEGMLQAYRQGKDLYAQIASVAFNKPYEDCLEFYPGTTETNKEGKARRSQAKSILLGVLYGRGVSSIAEQLRCSTEEAQVIKDKVFKGFPAIPKFESDSKTMARENGYVTTLWGRKRRLFDLQLPKYEFMWKDGVAPDLDALDFDSEAENEVPQTLQRKYLSKLNKAWGSQKRQIFEEANQEGIWIVDNTKKIADAERQCVNARIQGSAADMSKLAMIKVGTDRQLADWGFKLLIPVHDELIGECPIENAKICKERFAHLMEEAAYEKLDIPIKCDVACSYEWYGEEIEV